MHIVYLDMSYALGLDKDFVVCGVGVNGDGKGLLSDVEESCMDEDLALGEATTIPRLDA